MRNHPKTGKTCESAAPVGLRGMLEETRRQLLALFRSLDLLHIAQDLPGEVRALFELDATLAEALWVLDQPLGSFDVDAMTRDSTDSIDAVLHTVPEFLQTLSQEDRIRLAKTMPEMLKSLSPADAYNQIPGRDPAVG